MIKPFNELYGLDISEYVSKKPTFRYNKNTQKTEATGKYLDYINWADCVILLHMNGAEIVKFGNLHTPEGHSLFLSEGGVPEVHVFVEIDGDRREITYPVIDGSTDIAMAKLVQSDVHNASQRAMVKCVAINWGLGLKLWNKTEKGFDEEKQKELSENLSAHSIFAIKRRVEEIYTAKLQSGLTVTQIAEKLGMPTDVVKAKFASYVDLDNFEKKLIEI